MTVESILDARQPGVFFIEIEATRLIPAIGATAWTVYTLLVQHAAQGHRATACTAPDAIAQQSGLTGAEVRCAIERLAYHGLIEIVERPEQGRQHASPTYRIVNVGPEPGNDQGWARERDARMTGRRLFEALMDVCSSNEVDLDDQARRQFIAAVETIRSAGGNPSQVYDAALVYREAVRGLPLTPRNLAMCWPMLVELLPTDEVVRTS